MQEASLVETHQTGGLSCRWPTSSKLSILTRIEYFVNLGEQLLRQNHGVGMGNNAGAELFPLVCDWYEHHNLAKLSPGGSVTWIIFCLLCAGAARLR